MVRPMRMPSSSSSTLTGLMRMGSSTAAASGSSLILWPMTSPPQSVLTKVVLPVPLAPTTMRQKDTPFLVARLREAKVDIVGCGMVGVRTVARHGRRSLCRRACAAAGRGGQGEEARRARRARVALHPTQTPCLRVDRQVALAQCPPSARPSRMWRRTAGPVCTTLAPPAPRSQAKSRCSRFKHRAWHGYFDATRWRSRWRRSSPRLP